MKNNIVFPILFAMVLITFVAVQDYGMSVSIVEYIGTAIIASFILFYFIPQLIKLIKKRKVWNMEKEDVQHLQALCEELCENFTRELKKKRNMVKLLAIIFVVLIFTLPLCINKFSRILEETTFAMLPVIYIIILAVLMLLIENSKKQYGKLYKDEVINIFLKNFKDDYTYSNDLDSRFNMEMKYKNLNFEKMNDYRWRVEAEDCICGNINENVNFKMADIFSYIKQRKSGKNTLFKGNFMILDVNKVFEKSKIIQNKINIFDKKELVDTDNETFNKYFEIHAQNKELVQEYLTPSLIQFISDFREKYEIDFEIFFKDKIYIRFYTKNMFEPKLFGEIVDKTSVYKFYVITKFAKELSEKFII